jgi:hypothetical protein
LTGGEGEAKKEARGGHEKKGCTGEQAGGEFLLGLSPTYSLLTYVVVMVTVLVMTVGDFVSNLYFVCQSLFPRNFAYLRKRKLSVPQKPPRDSKPWC